MSDDDPLVELARIVSRNNSAFDEMTDEAELAAHDSAQAAEAYDETYDEDPFAELQAGIGAELRASYDESAAAETDAAPSLTASRAYDEAALPDAGSIFGAERAQLPRADWQAAHQIGWDATADADAEADYGADDDSMAAETAPDFVAERDPARWSYREPAAPEPAYAAEDYADQGEAEYDEAAYDEPAYGEAAYDRQENYGADYAGEYEYGDGYDYDSDSIAEAAAESEPPAYEGGVLPPHSVDEEAAVPVQPSRKGLYAVAAVLGIVLIGGASALGYRMLSGPAGDQPPPVIRADTEPTKVAPEEPGGAKIPHQNKLIYDRVGGNTEAGGGEERLVSREEPVVAVRDPDQVRNGDGARVVLPNSTDTAEPALPRRVRTVIVKPDGTIISGDEPAAPTDTAAAPMPSDTMADMPGMSGMAGTVAPEGMAGTAADQVASGDPLAGDATPVGADGVRPMPRPTTGQASAAAPAQPAMPAPTAPEPAPVQQAAPVQQVAPAATPTNVPRPATRPAAPQTPKVQYTAPTEVAANTPQATGNEPVQLAPEATVRKVTTTPITTRPGSDLVPVQQTRPQDTRPQEAAAAAPAATAPASSGGYVVQVSSQRSEDQARSAFQGLKSRYPGILGSYDADIRQADLGNRGVYYRVRVGPMASRDDANSLCAKLKAAGGDCLVQRN